MLSIRNDYIVKTGLSDSDDFQSKQEGILEQIRSEGLEPGFFSTAGDFDMDGDGLTNVRVIFEILAGFTDPGFDFFPITPFGWAALLLRSLENDKLKDLKLDYYGDLSGGGFLISTPKNAKRCSCGSGFKLL